MLLRFVILTVSLLFPVHCLADGGGPLLLFINWEVFSAGQIWIILSEFLYLVYFVKAISRFKLFGWVILINALSSFSCAILFPVALAYPMLLSELLVSTTHVQLSMNIQQVLAVLSTTVCEGCPNRYSIILACVGFAVTYFLSVWIEYRLFYNLQKPFNIFTRAQVLKHSYLWNLLSYSGLIYLFFHYLPITV